MCKVLFDEIWRMFEQRQTASHFTLIHLFKKCIRGLCKKLRTSGLNYLLNAQLGTVGTLETSLLFLLHKIWHQKFAKQEV